MSDTPQEWTKREEIFFEELNAYLETPQAQNSKWIHRLILNCVVLILTRLIQNARLSH